MKTINLREHYPYYQYDYLLDVTDEIEICMRELKRQENSYRRRRYRYKAQYSLNRYDGIEKDVLFHSLSPQEIFDQRAICQEIHAAISSLPYKQALRIYAHFFLGMSKRAIAQAEGIAEKQVRKSITQGVGNIRNFLKEYQ